jgi:hypothetical protein
MTQGKDNHLEQEPTDDDRASEVELLVGRFVDGEARHVDVERYTAIVGPRDEAALRMLLESKREHALLRDQIGVDLSRVDGIELPAGGSARLAFISRGGMAYLGWAAAIVLTVFIFFVDDKSAPAARVIDQEKAAPHIVGERDLGTLPPMLRSTRKLPDGRFQLDIVERRLRQIILDHFDDEWVTDDIEPRPRELPPADL